MRETRAEIDLGAIRENVLLACRLAGPTAQVMAVVKADAYGHGAAPVARTALTSGASWLGVALPEEAVILREDGIRSRILVLGPITPEQAELVVDHGLDQCVSDPAQAEALDRMARRRGRVVSIHLKVDTGMGRVGLPPREVRPAVEQLARLPAIRLAGLMTHFADADADDPVFTQEQASRFEAAVQALRDAGIAVPLRHAANSAALLLVPETRLDLVRPGIMLYGCHPRGARRPDDPVLHPALRLRTAITQVKELPAGSSVSYGRTFTASRDMRIATIPIGYADGLPRMLSDRGQVLIRGRRAALVGRVCMDMTMVDVTALPEVRAGDEAVLIGRQGDEEITADEVAALAGTISYEILCRLGPRVPRVYLPTDAAGVPPAAAFPPKPLDNPRGPNL
jgi:alanine racemase